MLFVVPVVLFDMLKAKQLACVSESGQKCPAARSLSLRRAWIEIGVCGVPATAWMSLSLFMSSVLRTCGDDSACAGLLVSMTIRGGENEFMGTRAESQMRRTPHAAHITIPARRVGHEFPDRRCRGPFPDIRNT